MGIDVCWVNVQSWQTSLPDIRSAPSSSWIAPFRPAGQTVAPGGWLQHRLGARVQGHKNGAHTKIRTPSAAARQERRGQEGMTSIKHLLGGEQIRVQRTRLNPGFYWNKWTFFSFGWNGCISVFPSLDSLYCFKKKKKKKTSHPVFSPSFIHWFIVQSPFSLSSLRPINAVQ